MIGHWDYDAPSSSSNHSNDTLLNESSVYLVTPYHSLEIAIDLFCVVLISITPWSKGAKKSSLRYTLSLKSWEMFFLHEQYEHTNEMREREGDVVRIAAKQLQCLLGLLSTRTMYYVFIRFESSNLLVCGFSTRRTRTRTILVSASLVN